MLLAHAGIEVESGGSIGVDRWHLTGLRYERPESFSLTISRLELPSLRVAVPGFFGSGVATDIVAGASVLRLATGTRPDDQEALLINWAQIYTEANAAVASARRWLPPVSMAELRIEDAGGRRVAALSSIEFAGGHLTLELDLAALNHPVALELAVSPEAWTIVGDAPSLDWMLVASVSPNPSGLSLKGGLRQANETIKFEARFSGDQPMPASAAFETSEFSLPVILLKKLPGGDLNRLVFSEVDLAWTEGRYQGDFRLQGEHVMDGQIEPFQAAVGLRGSLHEMQVEKIEIAAPWMVASLDVPLRLKFAEWTFSEPAMFRLDVDLSRQAFIDATGRLSGSLQFELPGSIVFDVAGSSLRVLKQDIETIQLRGRGDSGAILLESGEIVLGAPTAGQLQLKGRYDLSKTYLDFQYNLEVGEALLRQYTEAVELKGGARVSGQLQGNPLEPDIRGSLTAPGLTLPGLHPLSIDADYALKGMRAAEVRLHAKGAGGVADIIVSTSLKSDGEVSGTLQQLDIRSGANPQLRLLAPVVFSVPGKGNWIERLASVAFTPLGIQLPDGAIKLVMTDGGVLTISLDKVSSGAINSWLVSPLPKLTIRDAHVRLESLSPRVKGSVSAAVEAELAEGVVRAEIENLRVGESLAVERAALFLDGEALFRASGQIPLQFEARAEAAGWTVQFEKDGALRVRAETGSPGPLGDLVQKWVGIDADGFKLNLALDGTADAPTGRARAQATAIGFENFKYGPDLTEPLPSIQNLDIYIEFMDERLRVERLNATIRGGSLSASGEMPLALIEAVGSRNSDFATLRSGLSGAHFDLVFADWEVENWTPYLPQMLRRSGRLDGVLSRQPGQPVKGQVAFRDLSLRPTQNFPSVDSIGGTFTVEGNVLTLVDAGARVGGSPVSMQGELSWSDWPETRWAIQVKGENVPIVRRPDLILRSDLDVRLRGLPESRDAAELSGRLSLRSSTMLVEFDPLSPPVASGPSTRPPFFEVDTAPYDKWALNLRIDGERFLRVRSPYFRAVLSAGFDLSGTLGQPLLIGAARIEDGHLSFPGAKLRIDSGEAFVEAANPNTLQLSASGTARTATHVITMQVTGNTAEPQIQFEASPPLPNTSIVRLLSTGSATGGGAGAVGLYLGRGLLGAGGMGDDLGDRLSIDFGQEVTRSGRSVIGVGYRLGEGFGLQGEYDVYDNYNVDALWTIFEK